MHSFSWAAKQACYLACIFAGCSSVGALIHIIRNLDAPYGFLGIVILPLIVLFMSAIVWLVNCLILWAFGINELVYKILRILVFLLAIVCMIGLMMDESSRVL